MDRGAWRTTVHGVARVGHNLVTKPPPLWLWYFYHFSLPLKQPRELGESTVVFKFYRWLHRQSFLGLIVWSLWSNVKNSVHWLLIIVHFPLKNVALSNNIWLFFSCALEMFTILVTGKGNSLIPRVQYYNRTRGKKDLESKRLLEFQSW